MKHKSLIRIFIHLLIFLPISLFAQISNGTIELPVKPVGGNNIVQTKDGGFAVAGSKGNSIGVVKLDSNGGQQWSKVLSGGASQNISMIIATKDGGVALVGSTNSFGAGGYDAYVVKFDVAGNLQWTRTVGGSNDDYGSSIVQSTDGGYMVSGCTFSYGTLKGDNYLIKLDSAGSIKWTKCISSYIFNNGWEGSSVALTNDGGYLTACNDTTNFPGYTISVTKVTKVDSIGNVKWSKIYYGQQPTMVKLRDGNYAIMNLVQNSNKYTTITIIDTAGNLLKNMNLVSGINYSMSSISPTANGGFTLVGIGVGCYMHCATDMVGLVFDSIGNQVQSIGALGTVVNYEPSTNLCGYSVTGTKDGGLALCLTGSQSSPVFIKVDNKGYSCSTTSGYGYINAANDTAMNVSVTVTSGGVAGSGGVVSTGGNITTVCKVVGIANELDPSHQVNVYPNPSTGTVYISVLNFAPHETLNVFNVIGEKIYSAPIQSSVTELSEFVASGIYFYQITTGNGAVINGKFVVNIKKR